MKLTKQQESEALKVYHLFWKSYLSGDPESFSSTLDDAFEMIGTSETEVAHNKAEGVAFYEAQMQEIVGKAEMRNRNISAKPLNGMFLINENCDIYVFGEPEWTFYSKIRISTLLYETDSGWKVIQQHGSLPDMRVQGGETLALDKISKENLDLRDAVKRRTAELENKNRELEVEAALEKVRTAAMSMSTPVELQLVGEVIFDELKALGFSNLRNTEIVINQVEKQSILSYYYSDYGVSGLIEVDYTSHPKLKKWAEDLQTADDGFAAVHISENEIDEWKTYREELGYLPDPKLEESKTLDYYSYSTGLGALSISSFMPISSEQLTTLERFRNVFGLAYRRYTDVAQAEAQTREAEIELALEQVRARSLSMHKSDELADLSLELVKQVQALGVETWFCAFNINDDDPNGSLEWGSNGQGTFPQYRTPREGVFLQYYEAGKNGETLFVNEIDETKCPTHYEYLCSLPGVGEQLLSMKAAGISFPTCQIDHVAYFKFGYVLFITYRPVPESHDIFKRFAKVFEQTYTRFLDLQKAEEQAREAKIETALEKVRSRTMGMQSSDELPEVANLMFLEIQALGIPAWSCGYCILLEDRKSSTCIMSSEGTLQKPFLLPHSGEASFDEWDDFMQSDETFLTQELGGKAIESHYAFMKSLPQLTPIFKEIVEAGLSLPEYQINHLCKFNYGFLLFITYEEVPDAHDIFKRFTKVFDQTYTRFLDLEKAEIQARESQLELSLERIRSQVTAMQESSDLFDIVVSMRNEFLSLGHEADYFWYMRWLPDSYQMSMTSEDGSRIGMVISVPKFVHDNIPGLAEWEQGDEPFYVLPLDADDAWGYIENMNTHGDYELADPNAPTQDDIQHIGGLTFIIARTSHGEIGFSLPGMVPAPSEESLDTLTRFAGVFDLAYKRFEDLKSAEHQALLIREERDRLEIALNQLEATKDQLVQQEKLASLGQLTAGIAHEIKNPLNFVNNFSEVSVELIDEALEELSHVKTQDPASPDNKRLEETIAILNDVKSNLIKVHEHGSRADSIVKSMLQHSRGGSGKMEPTDLNALVKEYINLAFHGMRAGKNPINLEMDLQLDPKINTIPLIGEDFSRVILNLCNNAFDAMRETADKRPPKLTVRTELESKYINIEVEDNGPGIPDTIKDKILQPFFTTKKGTDGTGLGLSITNDIIKVHGGQLDIKSIPGQTIFQIQLTL